MAVVGWYNNCTIICVFSDQLQSGMASNSDSMAPDEMYLMLQADMVSSSISF